MWFQNRRAKEKVKATKSSAPKTQTIEKNTKSEVDIPKKEDSSSPSFCSDEPPSPDSSGESNANPTRGEDSTDASSQGSSSAVPSPPQLHLITDPASPAWQNSPVEPPPESGTSQLRPDLFLGNNIYAQRRGSLPVHALPQDDESSEPSVDWHDPLARRRSVDASLQRLASNPYAPLARAKNGAVFGPRFGVASPGRHHQLSRVPYGYQTQRHGLPYYPSPHVNVRHSSMDSRASRFPPRGPSSPSPAAISPYLAVRASLPDHSLYTVTSRTIASPIPGPLPSPNFSFGAASTPSMASPSSGDSERNSPDSLRSFSFTGEDDEEGVSSSYNSYSRFGSTVSIASEASSYYAEIGGPGVEQVPTPDLHVRRDSCASGQFLGMMSGLDVNPQTGLTEHRTLGLGSYSPHDDYNLSRTNGGELVAIAELNDQPHLSYPSPTSTISAGGSPHAQDAPPSAVPISQSSELAYALSQPNQGGRNRQDHYTIYGQLSSPAAAARETLTHEQDSSPAHGIYQTETEAPQPRTHYTTYSSLVAEAYGEIQAHRQLEYDHCPPGSQHLYAYGDSLGVSPLENSIQNSEGFITYS